jgi:hypothetical protein
MAISAAHSSCSSGPEDDEFAGFQPTPAANAAAISGSGKKWTKWKEMEKNGEKWRPGRKQRC